MKNVILYSFLLFALVSCGTKDKKKQLEELIIQRDKLTEQINTLKKELNMNPDSVKTLIVATEEIKLQKFEHFIEVQGRVDGDKNVVISPVMGGIITQIHVVEGQAVSKGDLLVSFDASILEQSIQEVRTQLDFTTTLYNKQKALYDQKIGSEVQYLSAKTNMESMQRRLATLNEQLSQMRVKSPIDGSVEEIPIKAGQMLAPGFPAMKVINLSKIKVMADIAEAYGSKVAKGNKVKLFFPDINKEVEAQVTFASRYINNVNRTFQVEVKLDNDGAAYRANMVAVVKIIDYVNDSAVVIPVNYVQQSKDGNFVMVAVEENGKKMAKRRTVTLGATTNGNAEIISGLSTGDRIITVGFGDLKDGQVINF